MQNIFIGSDHAGYILKCQILRTYKNFNDIGCFSTKSVDYPDIANTLVDFVVKNIECNIGILICGTGIGMSMVANRHKNIRAALCASKFAVRMSRAHNNANILCLGAKIIDWNMACSLISLFLNTDFEAGRHLDRINKFC